MLSSENIFHKFISKTLKESEINKINFKNLNNDYSKICLSVLIKTFKNHPNANLAKKFLNDNKNHSFHKLLLKFKNKNLNDFGKIINKENLWSIFSPDAIDGSNDPESFKKKY